MNTTSKGGAPSLALRSFSLSMTRRIFVPDPDMNPATLIGRPAALGSKIGTAGIDDYLRRLDVGRSLATNRLLKNAHLRRCPHPSSLRRTGMYASLLGISGALYLTVFEQPESGVFFSTLLKKSLAESQTRRRIKVEFVGMSFPETET